MNNFFGATILTLVLVFTGFHSCTQNNGADVAAIVDRSEPEAEVFYRSPASVVEGSDRSSVCGQVEKQAIDDSPELKLFVVHYLRGKVLLVPQTEKVAALLNDLQDGSDYEAKQICAYGFLKEGLDQDSTLQVDELVVMDANN